MTGERNEYQSVSSVDTSIDDAVGLPRWYIAIVRHNTEKKIKEQLDAQGYTTFIATQPRLRITPSGRKKWIDALVIHSKIFIHCTEKQRLQVVKHPFIYRFMTNPTGVTVNGHKPVATISDKEMEMLRFMLGQSDYPVSFEHERIPAGSKVKVIRGSLKGLVGEVLHSDAPEKELVIRLDLLGCAKVSIPVSDLRNLSK